MSPAKRTSTPHKRAPGRGKTADREVALPHADAPSDGVEDLDADPRSVASLRMTERDDDLERRIRQKAYEIYCSRDGGDGNEVDDWLAAEREVCSNLGSAEERTPTRRDSLSDDEQRDVAR